MRRIVLVALSTFTAVVLLFSYHTSTDNAAIATGALQQAPATARANATPQPSPSTRAGSGAPSNGTSASKSPASSASYTGSVIGTRWGPMQVQVTVRAGRVTAATAVQYPNGNGRDAQINSVALPILAQEAVQQQSAAIDTVSGATVTSEGYQQSLQSALDQAHL